MELLLDLIPATINLLFDLAILALPIIAFVVIFKAVKKSNDRRYELEKFKAETERMKAEQAQAEKNETTEL